MAPARRRGHRHVWKRMDMKPHPVNPDVLADVLSDDEQDLTADDWLKDIVANPDLYYADHVEESEERGVLPLSALAWRRACLVA